MAAAFDCGGPDPCLFGGVCAVAPANATAAVVVRGVPAPVPPGAAYCLCPRGYFADGSFFFQRNCAVPDGAYLALFALSTVECAALAAPLAAHLRRRATAAPLVGLALAALLAFNLNALALWLEDGMLEAAALFQGLSVLLATVWIDVLAHTLIRVVARFARLPAAFEPRAVAARSSAVAACLLANVAANIATSRAQPAQRNAAAASQFLLSVLIGGAEAAVTWVSVARFCAELDAAKRAVAAVAVTAEEEEAPQLDRFAEVARRMRRVRVLIAGIVAACVGVVGPCAVVVLALGSLPMNWALQAAFILSCALMVGGGTWMAVAAGAARPRGAGTSSASASNNARPAAAIQVPPPAASDA